MISKNNVRHFFRSVLLLDYLFPNIVDSPRFTKLLLQKYEELVDKVKQLTQKISMEIFHDRNGGSYLVDLLIDDRFHYCLCSSETFIENAVIKNEESIRFAIGFDDETMMINDLTMYNDGFMLEYKEKPIKVGSTILVPLKYQEKVFGCLMIISESINDFTNEDVEYANFLAGILETTFADVFQEVMRAIKEEKHTILLEAAEEKVKIADEWQNLIFENITDAVIIFGLDQKIIDCNKAAQRTFEYPKDEMVGKNFEVLIRGVENDILDEIKRSILQETEWRNEVCILRKSGQRAYYEIAIIPIRRPNGELIAMMSFGRDVTERYIAVKNQQTSLTLFQKVLEQIDDVVIITDGNLDEPGPQIVYVNMAFERVTGYKSQEIIGKTPRILQGKNSDRKELDRLKKTLRSGEIFIGSVINYTKDGKEFQLYWIISPIFNSVSEITNYVAVERKCFKICDKI
jgi:PAS domain S-box-containing protein